MAPPPDPALELIWQPRAHHMLPGIAQIRVTELARFMSTKKFSSQPREWQSVAEMELQRMMQMAAPPMPQQIGPDGQPIPTGQPPLDNPEFTKKKAA